MTTSGDPNLPDMPPQIVTPKGDHWAWRNLFGIMMAIAFCLVILAVFNRTNHTPKHDRCVVCKPSGKLAFWGECE